MKIPAAALNSYHTVLSIAVFGFLLYQALFWAGDVSSASAQAAAMDEASCELNADGGPFPRLYLSKPSGVFVTRS